MKLVVMKLRGVPRARKLGAACELRAACESHVPRELGAACESDMCRARKQRA